MPSLDDIPGEMKRRRFLKALKRLGFRIDKSGGNGSHYKAIWPKNEKCVTVQSHLRKDVLRYVTKQIQEISGLTWDDIKREM